MEQAHGNHRGPYRDSSAAVHALGVELTLPNAALRAELVDISIGGVGLKIPADKDPWIEAGQVAYLRVSGGIRSEIVSPARTLRRAEDKEGFVHYAFQFIDVGNLQEQLDPFYQQFFNRRQHQRVRPRFDERVRVDVFTEEGEEFKGAMYDLSVGGLGIAAKQGVAPALKEDQRLTVKFELSTATVPLVGSVVVRSLLNETTYTLIGTQFVSLGQDTEVFEREVQAFVREREAELTRWARTLV